MTAASSQRRGAPAASGRALVFLLASVAWLATLCLGVGSLVLCLLAVIY